MSTNDDVAAALLALRKNSILRAMACDPGFIFRRINGHVCTFDVVTRRFSVGDQSTAKLTTAITLCSK